MGIIVEVITPTVTVSEVTGGSTVINVLRTSQTPTNVTAEQAVTNVVSTVNIVQNAVVSQTAPINPYEGQVWIDIS